MRQLGNDLIQDGFDCSINKCRDAARAIIFNEKKEILLIYSSHYDDVSFPGGGVEDGESLIETLLRESLEEVGAVIDSYKEYYKIVEKRLYIPSKINYNIFTSYYYICTYSELKEPRLLDYEIKLGYESKWLSIDEAINLNNNTIKKLKKNNSYCGVVQREIMILEELKKDNL